jgi:HK97 gp10 family phage protein
LIPGKLKQGMMTVIAEQTATGAVAKVGPVRGAFYGMFEEFGTARQPQQSFLRRAFDEKLDEAVAIIGYNIGLEIEKEMSKS